MKEDNEKPRTAARRPRRVSRTQKAADDTAVEVEAAAFFSAERPAEPERGAGQADPSETGADIERAPRLEAPPPIERADGLRADKEPNRRPLTMPADKKGAGPGGRGGKYGVIMLILQAVLSAALLVQLLRTQMLPGRYLAVLALLLALFWLVIRYCRNYKATDMAARIFSGVLCVAMAVGCVWAQQGISALDNVTSGLITGTQANKITTEPFVIYLSGVDTRGELTESARSDVNILAAVNPKTKRVALINTPRDYYVSLAGTDSKDKLTHAGLYGVETSMATLGGLYGVEVEHYIRINFAGFISIVDALGGVDVYSDYAFTSVGSPGYYDPTTFVEGWNHLDGKAALAFARERYAFASGDVQRGINQMKVIDAMVEKIKSPAILMSFSKLLDAVADCFVTSLSSEQISALVRMQLGDFAQWSIESLSVSGKSGSSTKCYSAKGQKLYVMLPDESSVAEAQALIQSVTGGELAESGAETTKPAMSEREAYSATGDPNAAAPPVDETPAESEIDLPESAAADEQPADSAAGEEADASTQPQEGAESSATEEAADSGAASTILPDVEQAASSISTAIQSFWDSLTQSGSGDAGAAAGE